MEGGGPGAGQQRTAFVDSPHFPARRAPATSYSMRQPMEGKDGARRGAGSVGPTPGAATRGVSTEADSGSRGGTGRGGRCERGGPKSFLPNFRCLLPPPARAAAAVGGRQRRRRRRLRAARRARGDCCRGTGRGQWAQAPRCPPLRWRGGRERAAGEGPAPPPQNEPAVGHRHERRLGVPASPASQLGLPVAAGHAPGERLRCLPA